MDGVTRLAGTAFSTQIYAGSFRLRGQTITLCVFALAFVCQTCQNGRVPRKIRVQYPGAIYHVMSRGDRREDIYLDDVDRHDFLKTLA